MADIKACIFDLDGVIVDTAKYHYLAWNRLCNELGFGFTHEENESLKGVSRAQSLEILLSKGGLKKSAEEKLELMHRKNQWYLEYVDSMKPDEILPGAHDFIKKVKAAGIKIALGSSSKNAEHILEIIGIKHLFDVIIDGTKVTRGKPDPQTFALAAYELNIDHDHCVVFEDALAGVDAALAAGMYAIGVGDPLVLKQAQIVIPGFEGVGLEIFNEIWQHPRIRKVL
jgi:beta-phosphoglucomutase